MAKRTKKNETPAKADVEQVEAETTGENESPDTMTETPKKKRVPMSRVFKENGETLLLDGDVENAKAYVHGFKSLNVGARKGYDNYWAKKDGFTNPQAVQKLTPQGIGKMMLVLLDLAANIQTQGGEAADEMNQILMAVNEYGNVAVEEAKMLAVAKAKADADKALSDAAAMVAKANGWEVDDPRVQQQIDQARARFAPYVGSESDQNAETESSDDELTLETAEA